MKFKNYTEVKNEVLPYCTVPEDFFKDGGNEVDYCIFMISCLGTDKFLYLDKNFQSITGYANERFMKEGMDFWFSLICPDDMESVSTKIIASHKALFSQDFQSEEPTPLVLEYRFKHASGNWVWLRDSRYLVSFSEEKVIDKVLCRFEMLPPDNINALDELLRKEKSCTKMLEVAMVHQNAKNKQFIGDAATLTDESNPAFIHTLTRREKEILQLISEGLSTKMIADRCHISINTVETHRRHLLEKLGVKNSMELIKKASKVFWL